MAAACGGQHDVAMLLARGAEVNSRDNEGRSPLFLAAGHGQIECVRILLGAGAYPDARSKAGITPLREAKEGKYWDIAQLLSENGATD